VDTVAFGDFFLQKKNITKIMRKIPCRLLHPNSSFQSELLLIAMLKKIFPLSPSLF